MNKQQSLQPLIDILKIPSISTQEKYKPDMKRTRKYLADQFVSMGFKVKILKGKHHDAIFASLIINHRLPTVLIYGHYDVQPAEPLDEWKSNPFKPTVKNDFIYARGSADDKCQFMIHIMAVKKLLSQNKKLKVNFKFLLEGEEEVGSPSIESFAKKYAKNLLKCDYLIVSDSDMRPGQPCIDIGLRGLIYTEVKIQTAKHDLHSGEYGGLAENPINLLALVISKLKDENGKVLIPHFNDNVAKLNSKQVNVIKAVQNSKKREIEEGCLFGLGGGESKYLLGERKWTQPTLDVNGIWGGYQDGGSKTIIPASASAKISMRLVSNQDNDEIFNHFSNYVKELVPKWVKLTIKRHADCLPYIAPTDDPVFTLMDQSLKKVYGKNPIYKRVGGSIGFVPIMAKSLKVPVIMVGFSYPGSNAHGPNEHFSLSNYFKGIDVMQNFYANLDKMK